MIIKSFMDVQIYFIKPLNHKEKEKKMNKTNKDTKHKRMQNKVIDFFSRRVDAGVYICKDQILSY